MTDPIAVGDVVQLDPRTTRWGPQFVIVTDVETWGITGYFLPPTPGVEGGPVCLNGAAFIRSKHGDHVRIGRAQWALKLDAESEGET